MKTTTAFLLALGLTAGCSHSRSVHSSTASPHQAPAPPKKQASATVAPQPEGPVTAKTDMEERLQALNNKLKKLNKKVEKKAEKAGKEFRDSLEQLWEEEGVLREAWEKTKEKSKEAAQTAGEGLEAGIEAMEKALENLSKKLE